MRPIWKGHISFGLINIPIELYSAERRSDLHFKLLDSRNHAKIRYERINEETGEEVPWAEVVKAYEYGDDGYVILKEEDFKRAAVENSQMIEISDFVPTENLECGLFEKPYYLVPGKHGEKGYVLLRETLKDTKTAAVAKVVIRTRQYLAAVMPHENALMLNLLRFSQEIRKPSEFEIPTGTFKQYKISPKEVEMAKRLVESMTVKWQPEKYRDDYREALMSWIERKVKKKPLIEKPAAEKVKEPKVVDFMQLLKKSLQKTQNKKTTTRATRSKTKRRRTATHKKKAS